MARDSLRDWTGAWEVLAKVISSLASQTRATETDCIGKIIYAKEFGQHYVTEIVSPPEFAGLKVFSSFMDLKKVKDLAILAMKQGSYTGDKIVGKQLEVGDQVRLKIRLSLQGIDLEKDTAEVKKAS